MSDRTVDRAAVELGITRPERGEDGRFADSVWSLPIVAPAPSSPTADTDWQTDAAPEPPLTPTIPASPPFANGSQQLADGRQNGAPFENADGGSERSSPTPRTPSARDRNGFIALWPQPHRNGKSKKKVKDETPGPAPLPKDFDVSHIIERFRRLDLD
jgi:hypothetical protein